MKRLIALFLLICLLLSGCSDDAPMQETCFCMNTVMDLKIWGPDAESAMAQVRDLLYALDRTWSATSADSILGRLNSGGDVALSAGEAALLEKAESLSRRTGGAFDPKLRTVSEAWGFYNENHTVPTQEKITAALAQRQWDLGAAMKGWAGQVCAELLSQLDVDRATLNLGGNIQTFGEKPDGSPWQIGIQNPDGGDYIGLISITGTASIVTSGDYQRYFEADGVRYHHIIDPETGYPADSGLRSVTVICRDGFTADALSTALFVMGLEDAAAFWRESSDFEAVFILTTGEIFATEGALLSGCAYEVITR